MSEKCAECAALLAVFIIHVLLPLFLLFGLLRVPIGVICLLRRRLLIRVKIVIVLRDDFAELGAGDYPGPEVEPRLRQLEKLLVFPFDLSHA